MITTTERWIRVAPYGPLLAIAVQIAWALMLFLFVLFLVGDEPFTANHAEERILAAIGMIPSAAGLFLGILCMVRKWARSAGQWACVVLGSVICGIVMSGFLVGVIE